MQKVHDYLTQRYEQQLKDLLHFLSIPSISTKREHKPDITTCVEWLAEQMRAAGLEHVELMATEGNPIVYADWLHAPGKPTVLVYGHYDVQPAEPLEEWVTPPFSPEIREGKVYARGATDNKTPVFMHVKAIEAILATAGRLPINIKFCIEGEEEIGSVHLPNYLHTYPERVQADIVVISDTLMYDHGRPAICYAIRGACILEIHVYTARTDLHSGVYGGGVPNPIQALAQLLASLHDETGRVAVSGFYDRVLPLTPADRQALQATEVDEEKVRTELGLSALTGESGYSYLERTTSRPTIDVHGIYGGYTGEGVKTIVPNHAHAKLSCRLVANQDPDEIVRLMEQHMYTHQPTGTRVEITTFNAKADPYLASIEHPVMQAAAQAYEEVYQTPTMFTRLGGSLPIVTELTNQTHAPVVLMGFISPNENIHAPNEHFHLENFDKGIRTLCHYWQKLGEI